MIIPDKNKYIVREHTKCYKLYLNKENFDEAKKIRPYIMYGGPMSRHDDDFIMFELAGKYFLESACEILDDLGLSIQDFKVINDEV